jgi:hypothetical protein
MADILGLFLLGVTLGVQKVGKEKQFDDDKEDKQLDADDEPQRLAHGHAAETIIVKMEHARPETLFFLLIVTHGHEGCNVKQMTKLVKKIKFAKQMSFF